LFQPTLFNNCSTSCMDTKPQTELWNLDYVLFPYIVNVECKHSKVKLKTFYSLLIKTHSHFNLQGHLYSQGFCVKIHACRASLRNPSEKVHYCWFDYIMALMWKESVNGLSKIVDFLWVFLPQRMMTGWIGIILTITLASWLCMLRDHGMRHIRGALRKHARSV
jgi:hypothetical protein